MTLPQSNQNTEDGVTLTVTQYQFAVVAALLLHKDQLLQAPGKESGRALLSEHVAALKTEKDHDALLKAATAALERLTTAISLEYHRVVFMASNYSDETLQRFVKNLKWVFPYSQRYVTTLYDYGNNPPGKPNDLAIHVYVPVTASRPDLIEVVSMVSELNGIQFDSIQECWLGEQAAAIDDSWTLLP